MAAIPRGLDPIPRQAFLLGRGSKGARMSACPVMASAVSASSRDWPRYDRFLKAIPAIRHPQPRLKDTGRYPRPAKQGSDGIK